MGANVGGPGGEGKLASVLGFDHGLAPVLEALDELFLLEVEGAGHHLVWFIVSSCF